MKCRIERQVNRKRQMSLHSKRLFTIRNLGRGGIKFSRHDFFSSVMSRQDFFLMHLNLCNNFFSRLFTLCCLLARIFFL